MSIKITPVWGETTVVQSQAGQSIEFTFDISQASFARSENDLEMALDDGTAVHISNFFVVAEEGELPPLVLSDGNEVSAADFLKAMNPDLDLTTAAGPSASPLSSGTSYSDDGGALIDGVDRLGDLAGFQFGSSGPNNGQIDFFQPASPAFADGTAQGPDTPYTYLRVGLMLVGEKDATGNINEPRVELDLTQLTDASDPSVAINIDPDSRYVVKQDPKTGKIIFELKEPAEGDVPSSEKINIVIDGKTYIVQVGATAGSEMSAIKDWPPFDEAEAELEIAWGGLTDGHRINADIKSPAGYDDTELHLQMRDSSLDNSSFELEKGSLYISNEGGSNSPNITYSHNEGVSLENISNLKSDEEGSPVATVKYDSDLTATAYARGPDAATDITVKEGSVSIELDLSEINSSLTSTISGVFAGNAASSSVNASDITVQTFSGGIADGSAGLDAAVSAVRADGVIINYDEDGDEQSRENSTVKLNSAGDVKLDVSALDGGDHSGVTYAAVAATDNGHVEIIAGNEVTITATDTTTADAAGVYGIFSGYGMGAKDLLTPDDFESSEGGDRNYYSEYLGELALEYNDTAREEGANNETVLTHKQSEVSIKSEDNVSVQVNLGENDTDTSAAGIKLSFGDVDIQSGGGIDVELIHSGTHGGGTKNFLSAVDVTHGFFTLDAEDDVQFTLKGNGENLAVLNLDRTEFQSYNFYGSGVAPAISADSIAFTGIAGADRTSAVNHILGIRAFSKKETFVVQADEKFTIDVTAYNNGGATSSIGIHALGFESYSHFLMSVAAPEGFEINAHVVDDAGADSLATGIRVENGVDFGIGKFPGTEHGSENGARIDSLSMNVGGGFVNTGIELVARPADSKYTYETKANIFAQDIEINVTGSSSSQDSASYGVRAYGHDSVIDATKSADITFYTSDFNLMVEDTHHSVGLQADGLGTSINITSQYSDEEESKGPLTVRITSKNLAEKDLKGIAIEAIEGGKVEILGSSTGEDSNDFIQIDGHIKAGKKSSLVTIDTGLGNDHIEINGDIIQNQAKGDIIIDAGAGSDSVILNGRVDAPSAILGDPDKPGFYLSGGEGHDILILKADSVGQFIEYYEKWLKEVSGGPSGLNFESILIQGMTAEEAASNPGFSTLYRLFQDSGVDVQYYGNDVDVTFANLGTLDQTSFDGFGGTENDLLYIRVNDGDSISDLKELFADGGIEGAEGLLLDMVDFEKANTLDFDALNELMGSLSEEGKDNQPKVFLRYDEGDNVDFANSGWESGATETINGQQYTVYTHQNGDSDLALYVQLITSCS